MRAGHRRGDLAGRDGVDRDAVLPELERHDLGEQAQPALGGAVGGRLRQRDVLVDRGDVDDPARGSRVDHDPRGLLRAQEGPGEVHVEDVLPVLERELEKRRALADAGVVHEDVEPAELVGQLAYHAGGALEVAHVEPAHHGPPAELADLRGGALRSLLVGIPGDSDVEARAR